jgi:hypothetical protein
MPQSLVQIYVHLVFSTKNRQPFLRDKAFRERVHVGIERGGCVVRHVKPRWGLRKGLSRAVNPGRAGVAPFQGASVLLALSSPRVRCATLGFGMAPFQGAAAFSRH